MGRARVTLLLVRRYLFNIITTIGSIVTIIIVIIYTWDGKALAYSPACYQKQAKHIMDIWKVKIK